jgi:hypothetical protein
MSFGTFAAFSKFHLNTSKSTFMKVVQLVEGHNFHVDWHFKVWVEKHEKLAERTISPVHGHRLTFKVGNLFLHNLLIKTPYSLFESGRGLLDLQLSYSPVGKDLFKILEIIEFKQGDGKTFGQGHRGATTSCAPCTAHRVCTPAVFGVRATRGPRPRRPRPPHP